MTTAHDHSSSLLLTGVNDRAGGMVPGRAGMMTESIRLTRTAAVLTHDRAGNHHCIGL
jgi:hypothetical protein